MAKTSTLAARHPRRSGIDARERLLMILRSRQRAGQGPPSVRDLAATMDMAPSAVYHHVRWLRKRGELLPAGPDRRWGVWLADQDTAEESHHGAH